MRAEFEQMLSLMEISFRRFEEAMPNKPELVKKSFGEVYRYKNQDVYQAILLKLARVQSAVRAAFVLLQNGYFQEQAILHRVIDETNEDILFLGYAVTNDEFTTLHKRYLSAFWEEEIDESGDPIKSRQKRDVIPRRKIRNYIARIEGTVMDSNRGIELSRTMSKFYSGFVHGASPHIMDLYYGYPPYFHTNGMLGTSIMKDYEADLWNYMYRSFLSHIFVAKAFGDGETAEILTNHKKQFDANAEKRYQN